MSSTQVPVLPRISREYLYVPDVLPFGPDAGDVETLPVYVAFVAVDVQPTDGDWVEAEWAPAATSPTARILIGPDGTTDPGVGSWSVWLDVRGATEQPRRPVGRIKIV